MCNHCGVGLELGFVTQGALADSRPEDEFFDAFCVVDREEFDGLGRVHEWRQRGRAQDISARRAGFMAILNDPLSIPTAVRYTSPEAPTRTDRWRLHSTKAYPVSIEQSIRDLALLYSQRLKSAIDARLLEMEADDRSHFLIYQVLGISDEEGKLVDEYQNKGRFLYKYAGSFLGEAAKLCFLEKFPKSGSVRIPNTQGRRPKTFEIDCLVGTDALEIKWRDATTDGDHITKEHTRIQAIVDAKYTPIRVMFYYPNRAQAIRIQQALETLYKGVGGKYFFRDAAWKYVKDRTGVDLLRILRKLAKENAPRT